MRFDPSLEQYRVRDGVYGSDPGDTWGAFVGIPGPCGRDLRVIASDGMDPNCTEVPWEHVSVSLPNRCPNWPEMCHIKDLFFAPDEVVMQLHPAKSEYVNNHNFCLHLWRPLKANIPLPPIIAV
jgi:hypothetical protein